MNETETYLYWILGIIAAIFLFVLLVCFVQFASEFSRELQYLNTEIKRTDGRERKYWLRKRRRLWLSLIPFVRY